MFQSPKIGSVVSNLMSYVYPVLEAKHRFNPLKSGQLFQMEETMPAQHHASRKFQSPKIGSVVSNSSIEDMLENAIDFVSIP